MQAACWAAKVTAWVSCVSTSTAIRWPKAAIAPNRSADTSAASSSQLCIDSRSNQWPCVQKKTISTSTPTDHSSPIAVSVMPNDAAKSEKNAYRLTCASTVRNTPAKNQATSGRRSTASVPAGAASWCAGSLTGGKRQSENASNTHSASSSQGQAHTPTACSSAPASTTATVKPIEPQTRVRP